MEEGIWFIEEANYGKMRYVVKSQEETIKALAPQHKELWRRVRKVLS